MKQSLWDRSQKQKSRKRFKGNILLIVVALIVVLGGVLGITKWLSVGEDKLLANSDTFYKGIYIEKISLEGMTVTEAKKSVLSKMKKECPWNMQVIYENKVYFLEDMISSSVDQVLEEAILIGHTGDETTRLKEIKKLKKNPIYFSLESNYEEKQFDKIVKKIAKEFNIKAENADIIGYDEESGEIIYSESVIGYRLDREDLKEKIRVALQNKEYDAQIAAVMKVKNPELDLTTLKEKVTLIGAFTTTTSNNPDRNENIRLSSSKIHGLVLKPGEEFSMNQITGPRTLEQGYKPAGAFVNGKLVEEPGGGVCQVSTTLYNAVVKAGINTTQRFNHSMPVSYANLGEDAMISYPYADLKFENNGTSSILIKISFQNRTLGVSIYSVPILGENVTVEMVSEISEVLPIPKPTYEENKNLKYEEEIILNSGKEGKKVVTYLVTKENGIEISREFLHNSVYKAKAPLIQRNSKAKPEEEPSPSSTPTDGDDDNETEDENNQDGEQNETPEPTTSTPPETTEPEPDSETNPETE